MQTYPNNPTQSAQTACLQYYYMTRTEHIQQTEIWASPEFGWLLGGWPDEPGGSFRLIPDQARWEHGVCEQPHLPPLAGTERRRS